MQAAQKLTLRLLCSLFPRMLISINKYLLRNADSLGSALVSVCRPAVRTDLVRKGLRFHAGRRAMKFSANPPADVYLALSLISDLQFLIRM